MLLVESQLNVVCSFKMLFKLWFSATPWKCCRKNTEERGGPELQWD